MRGISNVSLSASAFLGSLVLTLAVESARALRRGKG
jgi:hypothetical protein